MSNQNLTYQDLLQIVELIKSSSHFNRFHLKIGELEVDLKRGSDGAAEAPAVTYAHKPAQIAIDVPVAEKENPHSTQRHGHVGGGEVVLETAPAGSKEAPAAQGAPASFPPGAVLIKSPMVGTFYRAPEPGAPPFAEIGKLVEPSSTVCIIEVMKLLNSIPAGQKGIVTHILVEDGQPVEFGQVLMVIDPKQ